MLTPANIKVIITNNLNDTRIYSIYSFISRLLKRKKFGGGIDEYRIKNINTNTFITSIADFTSNIDINKLNAEYYYTSDKMTGDKIHPIMVTIGNYEVKLDINTEEDDIYRNLFGNNAKTIAFLMNYMADGDISLPLKLFEVKII